MGDDIHSREDIQQRNLIFAITVSNCSAGLIVIPLDRAIG